ncbi:MULTISPECIES: hypothetical protein [unclassified Streptomyces]|uniref:hypothetical protein n=1 Tax=unclassified Streptomyces TaxID=2593676 RepID=UPI003803A42E
MLRCFEAVVGPLYGYALMIPALVSPRAPILVGEFLADLGLGPDSQPRDPS